MGLGPHGDVACKERKERKERKEEVVWRVLRSTSPCLWRWAW